MLKGLESYVDDNGVGLDDDALIVSDVFPRDMLANPRDTLAKVSDAITELQNAGLVHRYEGGGDDLLYISFWEEVQRIDKPGKGRKPRPDGTFNYGDSTIRESVANPRESVAPGTGEQGNREQDSSSEVADATTRPDVIHLLDALDAEIERNGAKKPSRTKKNIDAARLLLDRDGKTVDQVERAIKFAQSDEFWRSNVLSMSKLREKYDQLVLAAKRKPAGNVTEIQPKPKRRFNDMTYDEDGRQVFHTPGASA